MAFNGTQTRTWRDGTTPATGTIALGSNFEAEFNRLYGNWNTFFNAAGNQFSIDRGNFNNLYSIDGDGINFAEYFGYNIDAPVSQIQINEGSSGAALLHFTNTTTGATIGDGFSVGLDASENAVLYNRENTDLIFYTNNTDRGRFVSSGGLAVGTNSVKGTRGVVHIAYGTNADTNWEAFAPLIVENNSTCYINIRTGNANAAGLMFSDPDALYSGLLFYQHSIDAMDIYTGGAKRARFNATGLYVGDASNPSNLLHIQSTTTPQFRIAYDSNSYWTASVANAGTITLSAGEATGWIIVQPGASNPYFSVYSPGASAQIGAYSSDEGERIYLYHDGTNGIIATSGASAGNLQIGSGAALQVLNTTQSTSKDTGALIVEGGVGIEKNVWVGGNVTIVSAAGYLYGLKRRVLSTSWTTSDTENDVYDAIDPYLPSDIGIAYLCSGAIYDSGSLRPIKSVQRSGGGGTLTFSYTTATAGAAILTITDGSASNMTVNGSIEF